MRRYHNLYYKLTQKAPVHGCSCKLPEKKLLELLKETGLESINHKRVLAGVGDDAGVIEVSEGTVVVQHLDFFTPIIDEPFLQGMISACNSASDVYAKGATDIISVLMIVGIPAEMPDDILREMVEGFQDFCSSVEAPIVGGHTILCPWPIMGGSVTATAKVSDVVYISGAKPGDALLLTKPLGTQPVMAILSRSPESQREAIRDIDESTVSRAIDKAIEIMTTPNKDVAEAMVEVGVNAATDVTGFGILGHAENMAKMSHADIVLEALPVIKGATELSRSLGYKLEKGNSAETSGGLLISVSKEKADNLISSLEKRGQSVYEVGSVVEGVGHARISNDMEIVEV